VGQAVASGALVMVLIATAVLSVQAQPGPVPT
jgi:hypothetical protein